MDVLVSMTTLSSVGWKHGCGGTCFSTCRFPGRLARHFHGAGGYTSIVPTLQEFVIVTGTSPTNGPFFRRRRPFSGGAQGDRGYLEKGGNNSTFQPVSFSHRPGDDRRHDGQHAEAPPRQ